MEKKNKLQLPRIMLAAPASGSGKTMITCGILQALVNRQKQPASFKCGPDYIDPMFHTRVIGAKSRNLDPFFTGREVTRHLFAKTASKAGISVLEGVMGFYDGLGGTRIEASSYDLACITDTPVILIINARGMSRSVIPMICGYVEYQKQFGKEPIRGIILNQMSKMTYQMLKRQIEEETAVRVYGYVPSLKDCQIESRHLGLVTPDEISDLKGRLERLAEQLEQSLEIDEILRLAESAPAYEKEELEYPFFREEGKSSFLSEPSVFSGSFSDSISENFSDTAKTSVRIAVARDEAFCFYYEENLELLQEMGAELVFFSPLHDSALPENIQGMLLGGGYPELYAKELSENESMKAQIAQALKDGMPYLAECGGFMYLHESMEDMEHRAWKMCGVIGASSYRTEKLSRFGYVTLTAGEGKEDQLLSKGKSIRGHEFHYFDSTDPGRDYHAAKPTGKRSWECIHGGESRAAGYPHLYYWSQPEFAAAFLKQAAASVQKVLSAKPVANAAERER